MINMIIKWTSPIRYTMYRKKQFNRNNVFDVITVKETNYGKQQPTAYLIGRLTVQI